MADAEQAEFLVDGKPVFDDDGNRITSKGAYKKYTAKKEKDAKKAAHKAKEAEAKGGAAAPAEAAAPAAEAVQTGPVTYLKDEPQQAFGELVLVQSNQTTGREFVHVSNLSAAQEGQEVWVRGRVHNTRSKGNNCFVVLRQTGFTVQGALFKGPDIPKEMVKFCGALSRESVVDVKGKVVRAEVKSCTQSDLELSVLRCYLVSKAEANLPLQIEDAGRSEAEIEESVKKVAAGEMDGAYVRVSNEVRLDNRVIDLRVPAQNAIFRLSSAVCHFYRAALLEKGFTEIHSPKIIAGASEGGAAVFKLKYMEGTKHEAPACLAQSPQLYKQMCIMGDLERVFEVGPVFRAENSDTSRHLTEFTGLDFEMQINESYTEALDMTDFFMVKIFEGLKNNFQREIQIISQQYPVEPLQYSKDKNLRLQFPEAIAMLRAAGPPYSKNRPGMPDEGDIEELQDLETHQERHLGQLVKEKYGTDFWVLERFPMEVRPFYTMPCADDPNYSNSYDVFMRGQEIMSGAQRVHDVPLLCKQCEAKGVPPSQLTAYIDAFRYGAFPHAGGGIGLERVVALYLGLDNVRKTSLFPRDIARLTP
eukprot:CAMPEP_0181343870 /NCGR_PEP_ID=MMETSP1101-20121128/31844_1 /TAXON_ID=46948 /ORGANISM="Rhodomonas abbreviata, Strain Caron Lab Isolate" /LENGTH=587 /DNA_ID=CAMNT_0023455583 /DNA_START=20 /DNA_END=1783 /DNA_ORIENTATION=-